MQVSLGFGCAHHHRRPRRLRECGGLENVSGQGKAWLLDLYNAGNREAARALCEAEKAQHASGCLHCRGPHRQGAVMHIG